MAGSKKMRVLIEKDPKDKKFSIWVDLRFQPSKAERRKILRTLHRARDDLRKYLNENKSTHINERDGQHEISTQV
jgi:hypothetical protein